MDMFNNSSSVFLLKKPQAVDADRLQLKKIKKRTINPVHTSIWKTSGYTILSVQTRASVNLPL